MKEYIINAAQEGLGLHKFLERTFPNAPKSLLYKQLRKKNITLNKSKATGNEKLNDGDKIQVFFSDETIEKFSENQNILNVSLTNDYGFDILYEDENILVVDKKAGILSQKAEIDDVSLNEMILDYLIKKGECTNESLKVVKPSVCNRLDRNTSGIVLCGKTMNGLKNLSDALKLRSCHKYYQCIVKGKVKGKHRYESYLTKSSTHNQVKITDEPINNDSQFICTEYEVIKTISVKVPGFEKDEELSLLKVNLITGRSHQIRAHLASLFHPIVGDIKYGDTSLNKRLNRLYKIKRQLLHAYRVELPNDSFFLGKVIECPLPEDMKWFN